MSVNRSIDPDKLLKIRETTKEIAKLREELKAILEEALPVEGEHNK
jgi:hypothetical protein